MSLIRMGFIRAAMSWGVLWTALTLGAPAQAISTTTVQGTVYLANGTPGSGTLQVSWPAFTTAQNQAVAAGKVMVEIGADGFMSVNLAPNLGSSPAGLFYTAIYHMSDGTTSTEYWVVPAAAQASIGQVRSQVMPAAQAVQTVSKAYVDQAIQSVAQGNLTGNGGQLTGPLYLTGDPTQALQAASKHYVDATFAQAVPLAGGVVTGSLTAKQMGAAYQVDQFAGADFGAKLQACLQALSSAYGGTCDARNFNEDVSMASDVTISTANAMVMLPCATISTANQIVVTAGTRNVSLRGCSLRGASNASGSQGGTVLLYSGSNAAVQVGDPTYSADTLGFHLDNVLINVTTSSSSSTQAIAAYRTQEMDLESLYLLGNANQTGLTLDGTGNYTGGTFYDNHISGFQTALNGIGHQVTNPAATDWLNASTFVRLHINCPTSNGNPISGTYGINLQQGDGNSFTGGDVEGCATALHLGPNAQGNTIVGLRNENSTYQVVADAGSSYNSWMTGGTMFTGKLSDNGTRNSFLDTFHRSFNALNGDWYGSQQDATVTNHYRLGIGNSNERGLLDRYQTDYGYRWTIGLSDASGGEQYYQVLDELNNVYRISVGQYNKGQASTNNQTVINAAGTGAVVLNGSNNSGTGGVVFGSGGPSETTVATISSTGNAQFNGTLLVGGTAQSTGTMTVRNNADAEVDYYLWPGLTSNQKGSFTYKDYSGNSQWFMLKDANNNWALNSATGGLDSFKAYQSTNSGDTYINASNSSGVVRVNYETGSGSAFNIYGGGSGSLYASFSGTNAIKFPGLSATSGRYCLQVDSSGYISNTGVACGSGSGSGTVNSGSTGQIAYYGGNGTAVSGLSTVPVSAGGTGATSAAAGLAALGGASLVAVAEQSFAGPINGKSVTAQTLGGVMVASNYQNGSGNNGIANAANGASNQTIVADPSYATTERPGPASFTTPGLHYQDKRLGQQTDFYYNPGYTVQSLFNIGFDGNWPQSGNSTYCLYDKTPATWGGGNHHHGCFNLGQVSTAPGWSLGYPDGFSGGTGNGWEIHSLLKLGQKINSTGINESINIDQFKYGTGDNIGEYTYVNGEGGWTAYGDEGTFAYGGQTGEDPFTFTGTCSTGCTTGSTQIKATPVTGNCTQGVGRYLVDTTKAPITGTISNIAAGLGAGSAITISTTVPVSNAWGTLATTINTPLITVPPFTTSQTFNVNITSGTFTTGTLVCFAGTFHECAIPTAVGTASGGVQSVTIPLRKPHNSGTYIFQGGLAGYGLEATAYTQTGSQTLRYLFDVVGSTGSNTIQVLQWQQGVPHVVSLSAQIYQSFNIATGLSSSGTTVSGTYNSSGSTLWLPTQYHGSIIISGASDSALNAPCNGLTWSSSTAFTCTIAGLSGSHNSTTASAAVLAVNGGPMSSFKLWPMAEVIDVQNEATTPPTMDGTLQVEPNVIAFATGDTIEETHHQSALFGVASLHSQVYNPFSFGGPLNTAVAGPGAQGGGASSTSNAIVTAANRQPDSYYVRGGGVMTPPNAINVQGAYHIGLVLGEGPSSQQPVIQVSPTSAQSNDPNYSYYAWQLYDKTSSTYLAVNPYSGNSTFNTPGAATWQAANHTFTGSVTFNSSVSLPANGVSAGTYTNPSITVGADGRVTSASSGVANVQITTGTTQIAANTCTSNTATTMTGLTATSAIVPPTPTSSTVGVTGWGTDGLVFKYYVAANTFNWSVCNVTGSSITPGASITWNVGAR
ncbi:MAG TPA: hypothetical protein VL135_02255 [Terracidiphilus sp.]|nr:hypothetical protein [Terracidiphilus sp.]